MKRKDCNNKTLGVFHSLWILCPMLCGIIAAAPAIAGTVRVRATTMVGADEIRLADVCDFEGFDPITERSAAQALLGVSPTSGNTATIHLEAVRNALSRAGVNMAEVTLTGAMRCLVSRPATRVTGSSASDRHPRPMNRANLRAGGHVPVVHNDSSSPSPTLRDAVFDHFTRALSQYRGRPEIVFDRTDADVLDLPAATHSFHVRSRSEGPLGLLQVEVDVVASGKDQRTVPLVVNVSMTRDVFVARRAINQGATLSPGDIARTSLIFTRVDGRLGVVDADRIVGKRARRFIPPGSVIHMNRLETVPLVARGQFVRLRSREGGIEIVTTGKAMQGGILGESITVRALDGPRLQFQATIVGVGVVEVGAAPARSASIAGSGGGQS